MIVETDPTVLLVQDERIDDVVEAEPERDEIGVEGQRLLENSKLLVGRVAVNACVDYLERRIARGVLAQPLLEMCTESPLVVYSVAHRHRISEHQCSKLARRLLTREIGVVMAPAIDRIDTLDPTLPESTLCPGPMAVVKLDVVLRQGAKCVNR